ncbi:uncharacterized protein LOC123538489 [Mercenaria mercenaria]|uniref:uncharacterized protein LOC123538489 n=1 Tax=Mercenaria mercenaria TaxID=6596 RepID=UPI00234F4BC8|nr:uncharacterized protein LOC123538489 [Mercenaria mercenaria]XP_053386542.1 uncharacterized protein LOC123538489 [Mercenaria mercenaria]
MAEKMDVESPMTEEKADTKDSILDDPVYCDPCLLSENETTAFKYCNECEEKLCDDCAKSHSKRKVTSSHKLISVEDIVKNAEGNPLCSPCADTDKRSKADTFCKECDEYLCSQCTRSHKMRRATRFHEPIDVEYLKSQSRQSDEMIPLCQPCEDNNSATRAANYCKECDEYLCESCTKKHLNRKATKSHTPVSVSLLQNEQEGQVEPDKICDPCVSVNRNKIAASFCQECEELLCAECTNQHRTKKITKSHSLKSPEFVEYVKIDCTICDNRSIQAVMFCKSCEEALCELCAKKHSSQKITKTHTLESIKGIILKQMIPCDPCQDNDEVKKAETYCIQCKENLCESCTSYHKGQKVTRQHELSTPKEPVSTRDVSCDPCMEREIKMNAKVHCLECEENLCNDCEQRHRKLKLTKSHKFVSLNEAPKRDLKCCDQCETGESAIKYCADCQGYVCCECCKAHERTKLLKTHKLIEIEDVDKVIKPDCNSCNKRGAAESYCKECEEFYCKDCCRQHQSMKATRTHQLVSAEEGLKDGSARANVDDESTNLSGQPTGNERNTVTKHVDNEAKDRPGKPRISDVLADSVTLSWDPPSTFGEDDYYQISFKDLDHNKKWRFFQAEFRSSTAVLNDVKSNTVFIFRVRVVYEDGEGPYSEESDKIVTSDSPATRIVKFALKKTAGNPSPSKYALPVTEIRAARNEKAKTKKFELGAPPLVEGKSRTIMLVGATGTGKSTLVDGIVNYILGVNWDDPFRFTVIDLEQEEKDREKNQALSQTEWITCYTINPEKGSRLKCQLNIIDTPGFGDTRGLKRDQEIVEQIRQLFSEKQPKGVTFIDAVCFLIKAPDARLTAVQSYIFQSVMSLFGKDIEKNICSLITFADGVDPPVLAALNESGLPFGQSFTFNNSGLFAKNVNISAASLSPMFWDMGLKSFRAFFDHLGKVETKSLQLTKDVLDERSRLEATIKNLQPQLDAGLSKVNCLKQEIKIIEQNKSLIKDNKDFEYEVEETQQKKKELPRGQHVTNCTNCHFTCHDNCAFANDDEKARCCAMGPDGNCKICPDNCHWQKHANTPYIFEYVNVKVKKTYADMQKKYKEATGKLLSQEEIVEKLGEELGDLLDDIEDMMVIIKSCTERLEEIALRPNPLTMTEHIDLMIENEKLEKKDGFLQRINVLNEFRKRAQISTEFEQFKTEANATLGSVGKKRNRDTKSILARMGAWFKDKLS